MICITSDESCCVLVELLFLVTLPQKQAGVVRPASVRVSGTATSFGVSVSRVFINDGV